MSDLLHRDDVPLEVVLELEKTFQEMFPGFKVCFAGDAPADSEMAQRNQEILASINRMNDASLANGTCVDCGQPMPSYDPENPDWEPSPGWCSLREMPTDRIVAWICPECDEEDEKGEPVALPL